LKEFMGDNCLSLTRKSSELTVMLKKKDKDGDGEDFRTRYPDYDGPVLGGWRVLIMMSCGPAIIKEGHLMRVTKLVEQ
jgi:hypothetical protein